MKQIRKYSSFFLKIRNPDSLGKKSWRIIFLVNYLLQLFYRRSSQQIKNVTIFFVFFMTLYAIMGVQLFGHMNYHCVRNGTDSSNVTINDLAIPDTMCSDKDGGEFKEHIFTD